MGDGEDRVVEEHSGAGVFHDGFDLLTFIAGVAVNLAGAAEGFCFHKGALVGAVQGVGLKLLALGAELSPFCMVIAAAVDGDHLGKTFFFHPPAGFGVFQCGLDTDSHNFLLCPPPLYQKVTGGASNSG